MSTDPRVARAMELAFDYVRAWDRVRSCVAPRAALKAHLESMTAEIVRLTAELEEARKDAGLRVWCGPMPETNGKSNFTAILHRGDLASGHTIARSEYQDQVRYHADCVRWLIGELKDRPFILDYDEKLHSGYVAAAMTEEKPNGRPEQRRP